MKSPVLLNRGIYSIERFHWDLQHSIGANGAMSAHWKAMRHNAPEMGGVPIPCVEVL